jgi:hypothetical protein
MSSSNTKGKGKAREIGRSQRRDTEERHEEHELGYGIDESTGGNVSATQSTYYGSEYHIRAMNSMTDPKDSALYAMLHSAVYGGSNPHEKGAGSRHQGQGHEGHSCPQPPTNPY